MFGYLRFFLAYLVLLSHLLISFYSINIGVFAVVIFYILAGYVVSNLYLNILSDTKYKTLAFYKDRIKRIFPLYFYTLSVSFIFIWFSNYGEPKYSFQNIFSNLTIIPLNYYMYLDSTILQNPNWALIPPAWSLGAELQAYILLSIMFLYKRTKYLFGFFTLFIYILANLTIIESDYFGYRLLVGVLFIFIVGSSIQKIKSNKCEDNFDKYFPLFVWFVSFILFILIHIKGYVQATDTKDTILGLLIGIPIIYLLSRNKKKLPFDTIMGKLSYGIFLSHFLAIWILDYYSFSTNSKYYILCVSLISIFIAIIGVLFIENRNAKL